jgi:hypothetical protein
MFSVYLGKIWSIVYWQLLSPSSNFISRVESSEWSWSEDARRSVLRAKLKSNFCTKIFKSFSTDAFSIKFVSLCSDWKTVSFTSCRHSITCVSNIWGWKLALKDKCRYGRIEQIFIALKIYYQLSDRPMGFNKFQLPVFLTGKMCDIFSSLH